MELLHLFVCSCFSLLSKLPESGFETISFNERYQFDCFAIFGVETIEVKISTSVCLVSDEIQMVHYLGCYICSSCHISANLGDLLLTSSCSSCWSWLCCSSISSSCCSCGCCSWVYWIWRVVLPVILAMSSFISSSSSELESDSESVEIHVVGVIWVRVSVRIIGIFIFVLLGAIHFGIHNG